MQTRLVPSILAVALTLLLAVGARAADRPQLVVLPILPAQGQADDGLALGVQNALEMTLYVHDGLKREAFLWEIKKLFPSEKDFLDYAAGAGPGLSLAQAAKQAGVRYVLEGRITDAAQRTVSVRLFDAQTGSTAESVLPLDADTGLKGLREGLLNVLAANGLPLSAQQRPKALWEEKTSLPALKALGAATREHYAVQGFKAKEAKPSLAPYQQATQLAPESYLARNWLGWGLWRTEDLPGIKREFEAAVTLNPAGVDALDGLISIAKKQNDIPGLKQWSARMAQARGENPDEAVATDLLEYAESLRDQGKYKQALQPAREALAIREKALGPEHPDTAVTVSVLADITQADGDYAAAKPLYERALAIREKALGPEDKLTTVTMFRLASVLEQSGDLSGAKALYERVLAADEKRYGPEHEEVATDLNALAGVFSSLGDSVQAKALYERALAIREKVLGPEDKQTTVTMFRLASVLEQSGDLSGAKALYERVLAADEKRYGPEHEEVATDLNALAGVFSSLGDSVQAKALCERALAIRKGGGGPEDKQTTVTMFSLATGLEQSGDLPGAKALYERILAADEKRYGLEHAEVAPDLIALAAVLVSLGDFVQAKALYERVLAVDEKRYGPEHVEVATDLDALAGVFSSLGDFAQAKVLYERALTIREKELGPEHPDTATSLNNLACALSSLGQYAQAKALCERALAISEKVLGPEQPETVTSLNNLAAVLSYLGEHAQAKVLDERALAISEKVLGPDHLDTAVALNNLAGKHESLGEYAQAKALYERALAIWEKAQGPEHPHTATGLNNLAFLLSSLGEHARAKVLHERALAIQEKALGPDHPDTAVSLSNLAFTYWHLHEPSQAKQCVERALAIILASDNLSSKSSILSLMADLQTQLGNPSSAILYGKQAVNVLQAMRQNIASLDKVLQKSFLQDNAVIYSRLADLLMAQGRIPEAQQVLRMLKEEEYFGFVRRDAGQDVRATTASFTPAEERCAKRFQEISATLVVLGKEHGELRKKLKQGLTPEEQARYAALTKDLEAGRAQFLKSMAEVETQLAQVSPERARELGEMQLKDLKALQGILRELGQGSALIHTIAAPDKLWLILTTPDAQIARESTIKAADLNTLIGRFRQALGDPRQDARPLAQELYRYILAPLQADLERFEAKTLMFSLDGALRYVPMAALYDGKQWVAQRWATVVYTEVARQNLKDKPAQDWTLTGLGLTHAVAGFNPLPAVRGELESVSQAIPGTVKLDDQFTEDALRQALDAAPVLHIASHFQFNPGTEKDSFLVLGTGDRMTLDKLKLMDFNEVDVLTLSACETAVGGGAKMGNGQEVESFGAMAQRQGAKGVLATLWSVDDDSTGELMRLFYGLRRSGGLSKAEALRQAQLELIEGKVTRATAAVRRGEAVQASGGAERSDSSRTAASVDYAHPFYWAPFILIGNWR
ncbi:hypothetical protein JCM15519_33730 [Fundidesulfovibrio butyratiphilus]